MKRIAALNLLLRRVARVMIWWFARALNKAILPTGYRVFERSLTLEEPATLRESYRANCADGKVDSDEHEDRCLFKRLEAVNTPVLSDEASKSVRAQNQVIDDPNFVKLNCSTGEISLVSGSRWRPGAFAAATKLFLWLTKCTDQNDAIRFRLHILSVGTFFADALGGLRLLPSNPVCCTAASKEGVTDLSARCSSDTVIGAGLKGLFLCYEGAP